MLHTKYVFLIYEKDIELPAEQGPVKWSPPSSEYIKYTFILYISCISFAYVSVHTQKIF